MACLHGILLLLTLVTSSDLEQVEINIFHCEKGTTVRYKQKFQTQHIIAQINHKPSFYFLNLHQTRGTLITT